MESVAYGPKIETMYGAVKLFQWNGMPNKEHIKSKEVREPLPDRAQLNPSFDPASGKQTLPFHSGSNPSTPKFSRLRVTKKGNKHQGLLRLRSNRNLTLRRQ